MPKNNNGMSQNSSAGDAAAIDEHNDLSQKTWVTDYAWISGVAGAIALFLCASWFNDTNALNNGIKFAGRVITTDRTHTMMAALLGSSAVMLLVEFIRLWLRERGQFISIDPDIKAGNYSNYLKFFWSCLKNYLLNLGLIFVVIGFYYSAGVYAYQQSNGGGYYGAWFEFLELVKTAYLYGGFPYVLITRAFKYDPMADRKDSAMLFARVLQFLVSYVGAFKEIRPAFDEHDKKAARALLVKVFFTPLMTVFFFGQFPHLVNNIGYVFHSIPESIRLGQYTHERFNGDLFNVSIAVIFSVDVALAWCGYVVSSRWVDNQTTSAEPTMLGWFVCLICYPPFQFYGLYYSSPGEREVLQYQNQWLITIFELMMVLSYLVYMAAPLWFGVRFSNVTNRGIIRKGPFAFIRHPAYASKNFAWWCVMFPAIIHNATTTGVRAAVLQAFGLVLMTSIYYMRAITEERHLSVDPYYRAYCEQVKYRFIPGVI